MSQSSLQQAHLIIKYLDVDNLLSSLDLPNLKQADQETVDLVITLVKAIKQHEEYIQNLIKFINGEIDWNPPPYTKCKFGQSYYKIDIQQLQRYGDEIANLFKRIGTLHIEFHTIAEKLMEAPTATEQRLLALELASKSKVLIDTITLFVQKIHNMLT